VQRRAGQPGDLRHHEHIAGLCLCQDVANLPRLPWGVAAARVFNDGHRRNRMTRTVFEDAQFLIGDVLRRGGDTEIRLIDHG